MNATTDLPVVDERADLIRVLESDGWYMPSSGPIGEMWKSPRGRSVGIPFGLSRTDWEWVGVIDRVADGMSLNVAAVDALVRGFWADVFDFRAGTALSSQHTISASSGSDLFANVWRLLRASATAAQKPQPRIVNWSRVGDRAVAGAQFGQTRPGSYILPLLVPLRPTTTMGDSDTQGLPVEGMQRTMREPGERRVTRTMYQAMRALQSTIIDPERVPNQSVVDELIQMGVTREMLTSVRSIITHQDVSGLDISPTWAQGLPVDGLALSKVVEIPADAERVLEHTIPKFKKTKVPQAELLSGPIFRMLHREGEGHGVATIDTRRNGRTASVDIYLAASKDVERAHDWFKQHTIIEVQGTVERTNSGTFIRRPSDLRALNESMLFG